MTLDCDAITRSLGPWLDGELAPAEAERVRSHLQLCPSCLSEKARLEALQAGLRSALEAEASEIAFEPFWRGVRQRISEKKPWPQRLGAWVRGVLYPEGLAWAIPALILVMLGVLSLESFFPEWRWGFNKANLAAVESIDGHGFNVAVFGESRSKTTVIWLFENDEDEDVSTGENPPAEASF